MLLPRNVFLEGLGAATLLWGFIPLVTEIGGLLIKTLN